MKKDKVLEGILAQKLEQELKITTKQLNKKRTLKDVPISDTTDPLRVDASLRVGNVVEPDKETDWKDVKEKD